MKSCDKCMRGPRNKAESKYCAQCGDDLVYFVPSNFAEERTREYDHIHTLDELAGLVRSENSNDEEHYSPHVMSAPPDARIVPVAVNVYNECDDILFSLKSFDEFTVEVEWKTLVGNANLDECCQLLRDAVAMMNLKG